MHEVSVVSHGHVALVHDPAHVLAEDLSVIGWICHAWAAPVLRIDEVGSLKGFHLVVLDFGVSDEFGIKLIALWMGDHEVHVRRVHPLGE